ncbi:MAG TPA: substrate-binding domain-containing protein [Planctomycetota bacterium]|nr:substrate-binding domain-containing protein [Planctomycetota bacterium]
MRIISVALLVGLAASGCGQASDDTLVAYGRENSSGTYMYFKEHVLENGDFGAGVQTLQGTGQVVQAVSKDKRAMGYGGIAYDKGVRVLLVKKDAASPAIAPSEENVVKGTYPISRYLFFYTIGEPDGALRHFIDWARGPEGQKVCSQVGYYPLPLDRQVKPADAPPAGKRTLTMKGSDTMVILGGKWVEHYMKKFPDVTLQVTGGGSGVGIKALKEGETDICQSSRPMKQKEKDEMKAKHGKAPVEFAVALDGLAIFVNETNPLREITLEQLKGIYTGKVKTWGQLAGKAP